MEHEVLRAPATCSCPEPDQSSPQPHPSSWRPILILYFHLLLGLPSDLFPSSFRTKIMYAPLPSPISATCHSHIILFYLTTRIVFDEQYSSLSFSCGFPHSPFISSQLPHISSSEPHPQIPSAYIPPSVTEYNEKSKNQNDFVGCTFVFICETLSGHRWHR